MENMRPTHELVALLRKGVTYRKTIPVTIMGEKFAVEIRPLDDIEISEIVAKLPLEGLTNTKTQAKTPEEMITDAANGVHVGKMLLASRQMFLEMCKIGITDKELRDFITTPGNRLWNVIDQIGMEIRKISNMPPEELKDFFTPTTDN